MAYTVITGAILASVAASCKADMVADIGAAYFNPDRSGGDDVAFTQGHMTREFDNQTTAYSIGYRWGDIEARYHDFGNNSQIGLSNRGDGYDGVPQNLTTWYAITHVKALSVSWTPQYRWLYGRIGLARYAANTHVRYTSGVSRDSYLLSYDAPHYMGYTPILGVGLNFGQVTVELGRLTTVKPRDGAIDHVETLMLGYRF